MSKKSVLLGCSCEKCGTYLLLPKEEALSLEKGNCDCPCCEGEIVCIDGEYDEEEAAYIKELASMNDDELESEEDNIYEDCVYYNDCDICPHRFYNQNCKLNAIVQHKREREKTNA